MGWGFILAWLDAWWRLDKQVFYLQFLPVSRPDHSLQDRRAVHEHNWSWAEALWPMAGRTAEEKEGWYPFSVAGVVGERATGCQRKGKGKVMPRVRGHGCYVLIKMLPFNYCSEHKGLLDKVLDFLNGTMTQTIRTWRRSTKKPWRSTMDCWPNRNSFWEVENIITHTPTKKCLIL